MNHPADPSQLAQTIREGDRAIWTRPLDEEEIRRYMEQAAAVEDPSLAGMTFAIKDNIDLAGVPTTAACPDYAYVPDQHATVVQRLIEAGAIPAGKTNLDQFATGLVGTRTPHGPCCNPFNADYIPGGSSSGSAVAVARNQVSFSLGTDTAGSGRVPAAFNNLVGLKPTRGLLSTSGVVPACRTLDCVSVFAHDVPTARRVFCVAAGFDPQDPWSRPCQQQVIKTGVPVFGVPKAEHLQFFGNAAYERLYFETVSTLEDRGWKKCEMDWAPFAEAARLLYEGPWLAERYAAIESFLTERPDALFPVTRQVISGGNKASAVDAFKATYRLQELRRMVEPIWQSVDLLVTPTAGTHYTIAEVDAEPLQTNSNLGYYTNYMNLLDLCAVAVPAGFTTAGMPFGVTFVAPALHDLYLLDRAEEWLSGSELAANTSHLIQFAVCGAHLQGLPLNHQITDRSGVFVRSCRTAAKYQMVELPGTPPKPGLIHQATGGGAIDVEIWEMPLSEFGSFVEGIPHPLAMGTLQMDDGSMVKGFVCEGYVAESATDITRWGSWRAFVQSQL